MKKPVLVSVLLALLFLISLALNFVQYRTSKLSTMSVGAAVESVGDQARILCEVAKEHLKEHWSDNQKNIERVIQVVNSPAEMQSKLKTDLEEITKTLSLEPAQVRELEPKYAKIFEENVARFRGHLNQKPEPQWPLMFETLKEFYSAEDKLIADMFGPEAREKFRESQARKRTPMLAIIAQYAHIDWDKSLIW